MGSLCAPAAVRNNIITCAAAAAGSPWCHILYNAVDNLFFIATLSSSPRLFSSTYTLSLSCSHISESVWYLYRFAPLAHMRKGPDGAVCLACENISNATHRHQNLFELQSGGRGRITLAKCEPLKWISLGRTLLKTMWLFVTKTAIFCVTFMTHIMIFLVSLWIFFKLILRLNLWSWGLI